MHEALEEELESSGKDSRSIDYQKTSGPFAQYGKGEPEATMGTAVNAITKTIEDLRQRGALTGVDVANVLDVSKATVSRWTTGRATPHPKTQLLLSDLRYVVDRLSEFYTPDETRVWLYARNQLLDGERAMDLIHRGDTEKVLEVIERLGSLSYI